MDILHTNTKRYLIAELIRLGQHVFETSFVHLTHDPYLLSLTSYERNMISSAYDKTCATFNIVSNSSARPTFLNYLTTNVS